MRVYGPGDLPQESAAVQQLRELHARLAEETWYNEEARESARLGVGLAISALLRAGL